MPFDATRNDETKDQVLQILIGARALIDTPEKWVKGTSYLFNKRSGVRRCMQYEITCSADWGNGADDLTAAFRALKCIIRGSIPEFNDAPTTTHASVMVVFDVAIAKERVKLVGAS